MKNKLIFLGFSLGRNIRYGGSNDDYPKSIVQLTDGGYITAGISKSSGSGDFAGTNHGFWDFWVVRMNSLGQLLWEKNFGGNNSDYARSIKQTSDGGYIVAGYTVSSASGDVTGTNNGALDFWIVKLDSSGTIQWQNNYGGNDSEDCKEIQQTSDGGYIVAGYTSSSANGDVTGTNNGNGDFWVVKLNSSGTIEWQKNYGGSNWDIAESIKQTSDGGYIVCGYTLSSATGDVTGTNNGGDDYWVVKLDSSGTIEWQKNYGGSGNESALSIRQTPDGGFLIVGYTDSSSSGDITGVNNGNNDMWIVKTDNTGTIQWQYNYGGSENEAATEAAQANDGGYVLSVETKSSASGDVTGTNHGGGDYWIVKVNSEGVLKQR